MIRVREKQYPCLVLDDYFQSGLITRRMYFSLDKFHHIPVSGAVIYKDDPIYFRRLEYASQEFAYGTYENYEKLLASGVKMPFKAEIDFDFVTNGKAVKQIVTNVVPVFEKPKNS
ncbi:hypothetical protein GC070_10965 [Neisseria meningitidis]|nr:hypothetical protein [Neisseria meningitidis]MBG8978505.1 hypothetical protein [Neisseria meningitidis]